MGETTAAERQKYFADQLSAKDKELLLLQQDNAAIKKKYEALMAEFDLKEVTNYSNILTPEISRISRKFGKEASVNNTRTINYSYTDSVVSVKKLDADYSSDSSSDGDSGSKMKESMKSVARNAQASGSTMGSASASSGSSVSASSVKAESSEAVIKQTTQVSQEKTVTTQQVTNTKKATTKAATKK